MADVQCARDVRRRMSNYELRPGRIGLRAVEALLLPGLLPALLDALRLVERIHHARAILASPRRRLREPVRSRCDDALESTFPPRIPACRADWRRRGADHSPVARR